MQHISALEMQCQLRDNEDPSRVHKVLFNSVSATDLNNTQKKPLHIYVHIHRIDIVRGRTTAVLSLIDELMLHALDQHCRKKCCVKLAAFIVVYIFRVCTFQNLLGFSFLSFLVSLYDFTPIAWFFGLFHLLFISRSVFFFRFFCFFYWWFGFHVLLCWLCASFHVVYLYIV